MMKLSKNAGFIFPFSLDPIFHFFQVVGNLQRKESWNVGPMVAGALPKYAGKSSPWHELISENSYL